MKKKKLIQIIVFLVLLFSPLSLVQAANDYCIWQTATTNNNPCNAPGDNTNDFIADSTGESCTGKQKGSGQNLCCCQIKDKPGQCSMGGQCPSGQQCQDGWCQLPAIAAPKFPIPQFQVPIDTVNLTEAVCTSSADGTYFCQVPWIGEYITGIYNYGLNIAGILAAIMLMVGGLLWLVSGGDVGRITQAKELIVGSITGLIILAASFIILVQINPNLVKFNPLGIGTIQDVEPVSSDGNPTNSTSCDNCVSLQSSIPYKDGHLLNTSLNLKLITVWGKTYGLAWRVTEAYPPSGKHNSTCHNNGMCVDIALTTDKSCANVAKLITILKNAGLSVLNEYTGCGGTQTTYATGGHLHVK